MAFMQIGAIWVNLDRVTRIRDLSTKDSSGQIVPGPLRLFFSGEDSIDLTEESAVLRTWLGSNAQVLQAF